MASIGTVKKQADGSFIGNIATLTINAPIRMIPNKAKVNDAQPDYRVLSRNFEIGAAWERTSRTTGEGYISLSLAAPELGRSKLYANLGRAADQDDNDVYAVIWNPVD